MNLHGLRTRLPLRKMVIGRFSTGPGKGEFLFLTKFSHFRNQFIAMA